MNALAICACLAEAAVEKMQVVLRVAADKVLDEEERHKYHMSGNVSTSAKNNLLL